LDTVLGVLWVNFNPAGKLVQVADRKQAVNSSVNAVVFEGVTIEMYATHDNEGAFQVGGVNWTIDGCIFQLNAGEGLHFYSGSVVRNCAINDNGVMGLAGYQSIGAQVIHCEVARNNWKLATMNHQAGGSKFARTVDLLISDVYCHHNLGVGLWTDISNVNSHYIDCIAVYNAQMGIYHEISYSAVIERCFAAYNAIGGAGGQLHGGQIQVSNSGDENGVLIRECTLIVGTTDEDVGLSITAHDRGTSHTVNVHALDCDVYFLDATNGQSGYWSSQIMEDVTISNMRYHVLETGQAHYMRRNVTGGSVTLPAGEGSREIVMSSLADVPAIPAWSLFGDVTPPEEPPPDNSGRGRQGRQGAFGIGRSGFGRGRVVG
jgi:hypothetical protein